MPPAGVTAAQGRSVNCGGGGAGGFSPPWLSGGSGVGVVVSVALRCAGWSGPPEVGWFGSGRPPSPVLRVGSPVTPVCM